ncbi:hypothetical protein ES332_D09G242900v1 [Gossypium tomentosum]|uniref:Uncharacterized protein n=1 Tax=Gossypium tomentosum TaxID=34277 RepID=A0A5D2JNA7_GOSTO|nr:hypothetical protein ES332_D09G242900v1 [Gossypium tomentosum]
MLDPRSNVCNFHNPLMSGILPENSLLEKLMSVNLLNSEILGGIGPERRFSDKSIDSTFLNPLIHPAMPPVKKFPEREIWVSFLRFFKVSGNGPLNWFLLRSSEVNSVRFPILCVKKPSYPALSSSIDMIRFVELSPGFEHKIPRNLAPVLSHGSAEKSHELIYDDGGIMLGSMERLSA